MKCLTTEYVLFHITFISLKTRRLKYKSAKRSCMLLLCYILIILYLRASWSWSYGSWIYNYQCNQCLSQLTLWVWNPFRWDMLDTTSCDKVCQLLEAGRWFPPIIPFSSTNNTDHQYIAEILLKVALNTIKQTQKKTKWLLLRFELISEDFPCPNEYFKCAKGHCVAPRFVCDGSKHCIDGDDEINCGK
jgi:hypothetical protein